jgi:hypothetical protein
MRISEMSSKIVTIGDSNAVGLANYGGNMWVSYGRNGSRSSDGLHAEAISRLPAESPVVIALGRNDANTGEGIGEIVQRITAMVERVSVSHRVVFLLFPIGTVGDVNRKQAIRQGLLSGISVPIWDLQRGGISHDGIHSSASTYVKFSQEIGRYFTSTPGIPGIPSPQLSIKYGGRG